MKERTHVLKVLIRQTCSPEQTTKALADAKTVEGN